MKQGGLVNGGELERLAMEHGYKASNASRRCRELENEGIIKNEYKNGTVWYKVNEEKFTKETIFIPSLNKYITRYIAI